MEPVMAKGPALTNEDKLEMLVSKYQLSLLRLCYAYLHDQQLAEDSSPTGFLKRCNLPPDCLGAVVLSNLL